MFKYDSGGVTKNNKEWLQLSDFNHRMQAPVFCQLSYGRNHTVVMPH